MRDPSAAGTLYLVATPIGNLKDITLRALEVLGRVDALACEDTRVTRKLLAAYRLKTPALVFAHHEHNEDGAARRIAALLDAGRDVAVCTDAGLPGVSDPGYRAAAAAAAAGRRVEVLPGASAAATALVASGLPTSSYTFLGFGPRGPGRLRRWLAAEAGRPHTLVLYESARRLGTLFAAAFDALGDRRAAACLELTKKHERVERGWLADLAARFADAPPPGEATVVIAGHHPKFMRGREGEPPPAKDFAPDAPSENGA